MVSPIRFPITAPQNELRTPNLSQTSGPSAVSLPLLNAKQNPISKQIIPQKMPPGFRFMFIIRGSLSGNVCCPLRLETTHRHQQLKAVTQACRAEPNHDIIGIPSRRGRDIPTGWQCVAQIGSDREPLSGATHAGPFALAENCFSAPLLTIVPFVAAVPAGKNFSLINSRNKSRKWEKHGSPKKAAVA